MNSFIMECQFLCVIVEFLAILFLKRAYPKLLCFSQLTAYKFPARIKFSIWRCAPQESFTECHAQVPSFHFNQILNFFHTEYFGKNSDQIGVFAVHFKNCGQRKVRGQGNREKVYREVNFLSFGGLIVEKCFKFSLLTSKL